MPQTIAKPKNEYIAHTDSKKRIVVRSSPPHGYYIVREYSDGHVVFTPCEVTPSPKIKASTLQQIERSIANLKAGKTSEPVNVNNALKLFRK